MLCSLDLGVFVCFGVILDVCVCVAMCAAKCFVTGIRRVNRETSPGWTEL